MLFRDLAAELSKTGRVKLESEVIERLGKKEREIKTFILAVPSNPPRAIYRKNLREDAAEFLSREVPPQVLHSILGSIAGL